MRPQRMGPAANDRAERAGHLTAPLPESRQSKNPLAIGAAPHMPDARAGSVLRHGGVRQDRRALRALRSGGHTEESAPRFRLSEAMLGVQAHSHDCPGMLPVRYATADRPREHSVGE